MVKNIDLDQAEEWRDWIAERCPAENTIRKHCGVASVLFNYGIEKKKITENPFKPLTSTTLTNKERDYYISVEEAEKVLQACPDAEWRLIFALAWFGGLRTPSETFVLRRAEDRFYVTSPKTEHHAGKEGRIVPIFPQLKPYLEECFEQANAGDEYVIMKHRVKSNNLRTMFT